MASIQICGDLDTLRFYAGMLVGRRPPYLKHIKALYLVDELIVVADKPVPADELWALFGRTLSVEHSFLETDAPFATIIYEKQRPPETRLEAMACDYHQLPPTPHRAVGAIESRFSAGAASRATGARRRHPATAVSDPAAIASNRRMQAVLFK